VVLLGVAIGIAAFPLIEAPQALVNSDWPAFAVGGHLAVEGDPDLLYNRSEQVRVQAAITGGVRLRAGDQGDLLPFDQPPWLALFSAPFVALGNELGARIWILVEVAALALGLRLLVGGAAPRWQALFAFATLPTALMVLNAQVDGLVVLGLGAGFALWRADREVLAGCALGLCLAKPHLVVGLALVLLVARQWRTVAGWGLATAALVGAVALRDPRWPVQWLEFLFANARHIGGELSPVGAALHLSIGQAPALIVAMAVFLGVAVATVKLASSRREVPSEALAVAIAGSLLAAPHALGSDLVLDAAALALAGGSGWLGWAGLSIAALLIAVTHDSPASTIMGIALLGALLLRVALGRLPPRLGVPVGA
jgi:hypothetical protein